MPRPTCGSTAIAPPPSRSSSPSAITWPKPASARSPRSWKAIRHIRRAAPSPRRGVSRRCCGCGGYWSLQSSLHLNNSAPLVGRTDEGDPPDRARVMVSIGMMQRLADEAAWLRALLRAQFATDVQDVVPLFGGEFSRAFAFTASDQSYVIRLNPFDHAVEAFTKDDYAWRHYASPAL